MIINTLRASGLWYTATVVNMPDWDHTRVSKAIRGFLWNGKMELVKRETCRRPWQHGSLSVVNSLKKAQALKLRWDPPVGDATCEKKWVFFFGATSMVVSVLTGKATSRGGLLTA